MKLAPGEHAELEPPLARLAARQHGAVSLEDLLALGYTKQQVETLVAKGLLIRLHRGVYAVGHLRLTLRGRWMAAVLACGETARLSHGDAAALWNLRRAPTGPIHVTAANPHRHTGIRGHRTRRPERLGDTIIDAIPVTTLERTLLDLAADLPPQRLRTLLEEAERQQRLDAALLIAEGERGNGLRGTKRLAAALALIADTPPDLRSGLEAAFLELIRAAGLPDPSTNVIVAGEAVDAYWPQARLVVEVDGWHWHRTRRAFAADRAKRNRLQLAGYTVLVFGEDTLASAPEEVSRALASAGASDR